MSVARIVPYRRGMASAGIPTGLSIVVLAGERVLLDRVFEVGRLVDLPQPIEARRSHVQDKTREITADDVAGLVALVRTMLLEHGVKHVAIEPAKGTGVEAERSQWIARELVRDLSAFDVELADPKVPKPLPTMTPKAAELSKALAAELVADAIGVPAIAPPPEAPAPVRGPRVAGIDPGSRYVAVVVAEGTSAPLRFIARRTFEVGRRVPLKKPKVREGGKIETHKRVIADEDIDALIGDVIAFLHEHHVEHVVLERATFFHGRTAAAAAFGAAAGLAREQWIGGELAGALRVAAVVDEHGQRLRIVEQVDSVSSKVWRGALGKQWRALLPDAFSNWPPSINVHESDAAGLALFGVKKPQPATKRVAGPARKRVRTDAHLARDAKRKAARLAAGCSCTSKRHRRECPLFVAKVKDVAS